MQAAQPPLHAHLRPFFTGLGLRPLLASPVILLLAMVWTGIGSNYGIAAQLWHEDLFEQYLAGLGAALMLAQVCLVAYLLDGKEDWLTSVPARADDPHHPVDRQMRWYLDRTWLVLIVLVGAAAFRDLASRWCFLLGLLGPPLVYMILRRGRPRRSSTVAAALQSEKRSWLLHEIGLHLTLAAVGVTLIVVVPNEKLAWLSFILSIWLTLHGFLLYLFRYWQMDKDDHRRMHRRAGIAFGSFFVVYQILFIVYVCDGSGKVAAVVAPPALICFLLLSLIVTIHGFLEYHFRQWYVLVVLALLLVIALVNGRPRYKLHFPGLDYSETGRVSLLEGDFEGLFSQLLKRHTEVKEDDSNREKRERLMDSYRALVRSYHRQESRWQQRLALHGRKPDWNRAPQLPQDEELAKALERKDFTQAEACYRQWRQAAEELERQLTALEYEALENWKSRTSGGNKRKPKLVVVAVSGGANRSALWTTYVLDQLEQAFAEQNVHFPTHVRLVSGASGGMVGASYWVATLDPETRRHPSTGAEFVDRIVTDSLTPLGQHAFFLDLPTLLLPGEFDSDRGVALEQSWSRHLDGALDCSMQALAVGEAAGWRPSLILSPMLVEDGRRLLISNLHLPFLTESGGRSLSGSGEGEPERMRKPGPHWRPRPAGKTTPAERIATGPDRPQDRYSLSAVEFFRLFPEASKFRLSTAVRMSATFPYFSPAVDLPTTPRRRVVDAGYYDNYGVNVAAEWLYAYRSWLLRNTSGVVLVQLRDSDSEQRRLFPDDQPEFWTYTRSLEWFTGPLVGAGSAREAGMSFRNDELVQVLSEHFNRGGREHFTTVVFESEEEIAMSWYLTRDEAKRMTTGFEKEPKMGVNRRALERLLRWWQEDHGQ